MERDDRGNGGVKEREVAAPEGEVVGDDVGVPGVG